MSEPQKLLPPACPACREKRIHTDEEWKNHPLRGHGFADNRGWTHPDLEAAAAKKA